MQLKAYWSFQGIIRKKISGLHRETGQLFGVGGTGTVRQWAVEISKSLRRNLMLEDATQTRPPFHHATRQSLGIVQIGHHCLLHHLVLDVQIQAAAWHIGKFAKLM